jgi:hypothetical protein
MALSMPTLSERAARMSWDRLCDLNDGHHVTYAYCGGQTGGPPCGNSAKLDLAALIEQWGDISTDERRRRLRCQCGARATITVRWTK